jgi:hypothetical protein
MRRAIYGSAFLTTVFLFSVSAFAQQEIPFPKGWQSWTHVTTTVVNDKAHPAYGVRHIYVNDKGKATALSGGKNFPDGSAMTLVFHEIVNLQVPKPKGGKSPKVMVGKRFKMDYMVKDSNKYAKTGGWNYARYSLPGGKYAAKVPYAKACFGCHNREVKAQDFVFSRAPK